MSPSETKAKIGQQVADCFPSGSHDVRLTHFQEELGNCHVVVTQSGQLVNNYKIHFDPNGTITASDPPLPQRKSEQ